MIKSDTTIKDSTGTGYVHHPTASEILNSLLVNRRGRIRNGLALLPANGWIERIGSDIKRMARIGAVLAKIEALMFGSKAQLIRALERRIAAKHDQIHLVQTVSQTVSRSAGAESPSDLRSHARKFNVA